jgi:hypothetical protein
MAKSSCCCSTPASEPSQTAVHEDLRKLLEKYDINAAAASVRVYALKP